MYPAGGEDSDEEQGQGDELHVVDQHGSQNFPGKDRCRDGGGPAACPAR